MSSNLPSTELPGAIPTLNGRGFMLETLDEYAQEFVRAAAVCDSEVLDIGCAYGVATLAALAAGARVCACDMDARHLEILRGRVPAEQLPRLRTVVGAMPEVGFAAGSFGAILASRVLHFLKGEDLRATLRAMHSWLRPGGALFLVADTPYMPSWNDIVPQYERLKASGEPWPGFIPDFSIYTMRGLGIDKGPPYLNTLDPDILVRECRAAGFVVGRHGYFAFSRIGSASIGREHAGCVAHRPG